MRAGRWPPVEASFGVGLANGDLAHGDDPSGVIGRGESSGCGAARARHCSRVRKRSTTSGPLQCLQRRFLSAGGEVCAGAAIVGAVADVATAEVADENAARGERVDGAGSCDGAVRSRQSLSRLVR